MSYYGYFFIVLLALRIVVDSKIIDMLLLLIYAKAFSDSRKVQAILALIIARWCAASVVFSWMLVLYSVYYTDGSPRILVIVIVLVWYLDLLYPY